MLVFGLTIFTGAFLLFLVQPLIARFILPWFGGGPAVWTTCMLFFQILLLGGYAYAHLSIRRLTPRRQVMVHLALLGLALALLPITPGDHWKPADGSAPTWRILCLLTACLGLPYLALAATGPLMQAWFSQARPGVSPYRLYALSNAGSLLALLSYPFGVEPNFSRHAQAVGWSAGLGIFAALCAGCGYLVWKQAAKAGTASTAAAAATAPPAPTPRANVGLWFVLPACGVVLLLAVTNKICQDIAVIPFLWVLPLSLYLLSFIITFDSPRWYWRPLWLPLLALSIGALVWMHYGTENRESYAQITVCLAAMFVSCMVCHGEVFRLRPAAEKLTGYYLAISAGGAAGGLFVALGAPVLFTGYYEFQLGFALMGWLLLAVLLLDRSEWSFRAKPRFGWGLITATFAGAAAASVFFYLAARNEAKDAKEVSRNFYGVLKIFEYNSLDAEARQLALQHGGTTHGIQYLTPDKQLIPTSYYINRSGIGQLMMHFRRAEGRRVAVVGLGAGCLAAWGRSGDYFRFYEINEEVRRIATTQFTFLKATPARTEVVMGDARLSLEREPNQQFDIIVLDAFSSDAIPVHLLTREAFDVYRRHLKPDGVIAVHISNCYLDLEPVVLLAAKHLGVDQAVIHYSEWDGYDSEEGEGPDAYSSDWILLTNNQEFLKNPVIRAGKSAPHAIPQNVKLWTDEESNLWRILMTDSGSWLRRLQEF